ncbi:MAG: two-component system, NarL family, sensor histidine kinase DesK, partial [Pseudonocardiales bacterium]|nr:two-component system, NarL family, sensor histidine kinase DesK [Pseudonocardiales bacterium]
MTTALTDVGRRLVADRRWIVVAVHLTALGGLLAIDAAGGEDLQPTVDPRSMVAVGLAVLALELRHGLAIARGARPRGLGATLLALVVLVYLPLPWWGWFWGTQQAAVLAAVPLVLRGRLATAVMVGLGLSGAVATVLLEPPESTFGGLAYWSAYMAFGLAILTATLYGSARLVAVLQELHRTRRELARTAVAAERLRVSRDLHDLLGQSLSAISLKGDLAVRLLARDPAAARAEVEDVARVAREALHGVRAITRDGTHAVHQRAEIDGATTLMRAAHIAPRVDVDLPELPPPVEGTLAWAVREGVTNVLRHSRATT